MAETAMDLVLCALLAATIAWCAVVHRRLRALRADRGELEGFVAALGAATERAEAAIAGLRGAGEAARQELLKQDEESRQRVEEVVRAVDGAGRMLRRLETAIQHAARLAAEPPPRERTRPMPPEPAPVAAAEPRPAAPGTRPRISEDLLRVLQNLR
ncbi:MAG: DUF6468 domain-containing protein [Geminicoccaceae bacterium]